jgi:gamma-glutamyltranspeptidase/glutathione hydrolase
VPGTGVIANNMMGEDDLHPTGFHTSPAGERVASMMAPSVVIDGDGAVRLVVGSGGSKRIRTALLQVIAAVVDQGRALDDAVDGPRLHWDGQQVHAEPGWSEAALAAVEAVHPVVRWVERDLYFGGVHAVAPGAAAGDPRRGGSTVVLGP